MTQRANSSPRRRSWPIRPTPTSSRAKTRVDANESARTDLHQRIDALKRELHELQDQASEADANARGLDRAVTQATKAQEAAHKELTRAKERLDRLT